MPSLSPIEEHLQWWGLQPCETADSYEQRQRTTFSRQEILDLHALVARKSDSRSDLDEIAFYNYSSRPAILPVLYSQRYHYYILLGAKLLPWVKASGSILDFGCGPGILTTYLARICPDSFFMGIDRSPECIHVAREQAERLQLRNVKFECVDILDPTNPKDSYEMVLSCQALLQSENDPGIPSQSWRTFTRAHHPETQAAFEQRTGLHPRLDRLMAYVKPSGRIILYEKVGHVGRRIPFQRAMAARRLDLQQTSDGITYQDIDRLIDDGPLYIVGRGDSSSPSSVPIEGWDETPTIKQEWILFKKSGAAALFMWKRLPDKKMRGRAPEKWQEGRGAHIEWGTFSNLFEYVFLTSGDGIHGIVIGMADSSKQGEPLASQLLTAGLDHAKQVASHIAEYWPHQSLEEDAELTPLYENHTVAAQKVWVGFQGASILKEFTKDGQDGRQVHIELGEKGGLLYLYCANTYDQRQLVVVEHERRFLLEEYYQELFQEQISENSIR